MHPSFYAGLVASFLPAAMRPKFIRDNAEDLRVPTIVTGIGQLLLCLVLLLVRYPGFVKAQQAAMPTEAQLKAVEYGGEASLMGLGLIFLFAYLLQPLSVALEYFAFEGIVRGLAAFINGESVGTLPLYLLLLAGRKARSEYKEHELGPRIPDAVSISNGAGSNPTLTIASCRPKDWNPSLTITYGEQLYELVRSFEAEPPRKFVYLLRIAPPSKVVRGLRHYDPQEVMKEAEETLSR